LGYKPPAPEAEIPVTLTLGRSLILTQYLDQDGNVTGRVVVNFYVQTHP